MLGNVCAPAMARSAQGGSVTATLKYDASNATLSFAADQLQSFLTKTSALKFVGNDSKSANWRFDLAVDKTMQPYSFGVACSKAGPTTTVTCSGPDASCVLSAVYTMLEKTGIHFEVTGPVLPKAADLNALSGWNTVIHPSVQQRGVRQHINFAMDVSSLSTR